MRIVPLDSISTSQVQAWERLATRAAEPNPFFEPAFAITAAAALGDGRVGLLVHEKEGSWDGCMPVVLAKVLGYRASISTWQHPYSFLGTPLVDADRVDEFARALLGSVRAREHAHLLTIRRMGDGPVLAALERARKEVGQKGVKVVFERSFERAALERRAEPDYLSGLKSRRRSELKRQRRRLAEALGEELVAVDRTDFASAADAFLQLESSGWKGERGTALASRKESTRMFRELCKKLGESGRLQMRSLQAGNRVVAMTCDLSAGDALFGFKTAYDETLRRYSPGIQLQIDNFAAFHEQPEKRLLDSCCEPDSDLLNGLWPDRRRIVTLVLGRRGPITALAGRTLRGADRARRAGSQA